MGATPDGIGGVADHVHMLVGLRATHCVADFMRELKKAGNTWARDASRGGSKFAWQEGYGVFTVSATSREKGRESIARQEEHHRVKSSREEWMAMLEKAGIVYDPAFLD